MSSPRHSADDATSRAARPNSDSNTTASLSPSDRHHQQLPPNSARRSAAQPRSKRLTSTNKHDATLVSPTSTHDNTEEQDGLKGGTKRACNECRQQKIDTNFKRVGKRKRNAEMEQEIEELRAQLSSLKREKAPGRASGRSGAARNDKAKEQSTNGLDPRLRHMDSPLGQYMGSHEAVESLLDLKSGGELRRSPNPNSKPSQRLEDVVLTHTQITELFNLFFSCYHPFLPFLDPNKTYQHYLTISRLLFWTIVSVAERKHNPKMLRSLSGALTRLLWATVADVPQNYHVVKALCILCVWPLPISSTSADPTFMTSGLMMQIAMQIGLHRPSHAQDFSKLRIELRHGELQDRLRTWAVCNIVAQNVGTGYGQPPMTQYDWTLLGSLGPGSAFKLPDSMAARIQTEAFVNKVTKTIYQNVRDPVGLISEVDKPHTMHALAGELAELELALQPKLNAVNRIHLKAAWLHLRLAVLFDPSTTKTYRQDLEALWLAVREFLEHAFELSAEPSCTIKYATNYLFQMILAAGFVLLKLLNSFFTHMVDIEYGKSLFAQTIQALRDASVLHNDLPMRLAEVLAQLWQAGGAGDVSSPGWDGSFNDSLQLKVTCRMSMSLMYDSTWRWREQFNSKGRDSLESALRNPVKIENLSGPNSLVPSNASHVAISPTPLSAAATNQGMADQLDAMLAPRAPGMPGGESPGMLNADFAWMEQWNNDVFDPLGWVLDGYMGESPFVPGPVDSQAGFP